MKQENENDVTLNFVRQQSVEIHRELSTSEKAVCAGEAVELQLQLANKQAYRKQLIADYTRNMVKVDSEIATLQEQINQKSMSAVNGIVNENVVYDLYSNGKNLVKVENAADPNIAQNIIETLPLDDNSELSL